jgi:hypothetical protein
MPLDLQQFGAKLKRYRDQLQISIEEISIATGIEKERFGLFEKGDAAPTGRVANIWPVTQPEVVNVGTVTTCGCPTSRDFRDVGLPTVCSAFFTGQRWSMKLFP